MKNPRIVLPALLLVFLFGFGGCYTILKHPAGGDSAHQYSQEYYRENCLDCHPDYHEYPYGYFYGSYPEYYFDYPRWGRYYAYPWWWERYWYEGDDGYHEYVDDEGDAHDKAGRSRGRMAPMAPPYSTGSWGGSPTFHRNESGGSTPGAKPGGSTTPADDQTTDPAGKTKVKAVKKTDDSSSDTQSSGTETKKDEKKGKQGSRDKKRKR